MVSFADSVRVVGKYMANRATGDFRDLPSSGFYGSVEVDSRNLRRPAVIVHLIDESNPTQLFLLQACMVVIVTDLPPPPDLFPFSVPVPCELHALFLP